MNNTQLTPNSLGDAYARAVLADISAHPQQTYSMSNNVFERVSALSPNTPQTNDTRSTSCKLFGANCFDESKYVAADCPSYLKFFNLCKAGGFFDKNAADAASAANDEQPSGCEICDSISKWFSGKMSGFAAVAVGFILMFGAFMIWKN